MHKSSTGKILLAVLLVVVAAGIGVRLYLPVWTTRYINNRIEALNGYGGSVQDIDLHLWRGAYTIYGLNIYKDKGGLQEPFVAARVIDLSVEWPALLHGTIVAEADLYNVNFNFARVQTGEGASWTRFIDDLSPFDINRMQLHGGRVSYIDYEADPNVNIYIHNIDARVTNLRNIEDKASALPSAFEISGDSIGKGKLAVNGNVNILKEIPDFDLNLKLENADLTQFNDYTRSIAAIDFTDGTISVYSELAAASGNVTGYVKPVANDVSVVNIPKQDRNPFNALWEMVASAFLEIFENQPRDQFALTIPIEGRMDHPDKDVWAAFISIFRNAFGQAFAKDTDGHIDFEDALRLSGNQRASNQPLP